ncbi:SRPBCC family protein [Aeromicrobium sp.]|uniref:SRPBCC family protein n=1 Tax=Aeromicrobium sp. TaxID=1871063 RepID=UPI0019999E02|nr:SRPBCC family protein [Aeromicrobium sp.]MBC7633429.1 SRPBCC family protein [Aeromicrobium sp.]
MELSHRFVVPASIDVTWAAFNDVEGIAPCFPGATLATVEGDEFTGAVKVKLGPIAMVYNGKGTFVERDEVAHRAVISAKGKDKRGNGTAGATVVAQLTPDGDGTAVEVTTDLSITGKPAQFGRNVMQDVSDKLLGQFVDCIAKRLGPASAPETAQGIKEPVREAATDAPQAAAAPQPPPPPPSAAADLNLMSTVMLVLIRRYGPAVVGGLVVVGAIIWAISRD